MTTANLLVGIDTGAAFESLRKLRAEMQSQPHNLLINVNMDSVRQDIQRYLNQKRAFTVKVNTQALGDEVTQALGIALDNAFAKRGRTLSWNAAGFRGSMNSTLDPIFNDKQRRLNYDRAKLIADISTDVTATLAVEHRVGINSASLTAQVKAAVDLGLAGGVVRLAGASGVAAPPVAAAAGLGPDVNTVIQRALAPAVNELTQAALAIASAVKKSGVAGQTTTSVLRAKKSISAKDADGFSLGVTETLENPQLVRADIQKRRRTKIEDDAELLNQRGQRSSDFKKVREARKQATDLLKANEGLDVLNQSGQRSSDFKKVREARKQADALLKATEGLEALNQSGQRSSDFKKVRDARKQVADLLKATEGLDTLNQSGQRASDFKKVKEARKQATDLLKATEGLDALNQSGQRTSDFRKVREARKQAADLLKATEGLDTLNQTGQRQSQLRSIRRDEKAAVTNLGFAAPQLGELAKLESQIKKVKQAQFLIEDGRAELAIRRFGRSAVESVPDLQRMQEQAELLGRNNNSLTSASTRSAGAHRELNAVMREAHSAARGLAGSMGALWTTYGSLVPLVAAAAIGASLRSIVVVGKDVGYQLAFVSALSGEAALSMTAFGNAVRGSMVPPLEAAEGLRALAQNGLDTRDSLAALPVILQLATAGELSLRDAALSATGVMSAFGLSVGDLGRVSDVFAKAAAISNTSVSGMTEAMRQASTVSDKYHVSLEQTAAVLATMAKRNIEGSSAGTAFRNMMVELATPTEKAKTAINLLGLKVFDSNGKMRDFLDVIGDLKSKTDGLNEQTKLTFLNDIFNERGAKAANSVLTDFEFFRASLSKITNEAKGFTSAIDTALKESTGGKIKQLFSEFQIAASAAFDDAGTSVNLFSDSLRNVVASPEFRQGLSALGSNIGAVATLFVENGKAVLYAVAAYASYRVASALMVSALATQAIALNATALSVGALAISWKALTVGATLGLSIIIPLVLEWALFSKHTDAATEAQNAFNESLKNQNRDLDASISRLKEENVFLAERNLLLLQGLTLEEANKRAGGSAQGATLRSKTNELAQALALAEEKALGQKQYDANLGPEFSTGTATAANAEVERLRGFYNTALEAQEKYETDAAQKNLKAAQNTLQANVSQAREFNQRIKDFRPTLSADKLIKFDKESLSISDADANVAQRDFEKLLTARKATLNEYGKNIVIPDKAAERAAASRARNENIAESNKDIEAIKQKMVVDKQRMDFAKEIDEATYGTDRFGPYMSALVTELRVKRELRDLESQRSSALTSFDAINRSKYTPADLTNTQKERTKLVAEFDERKAKLEQSKTLAGIKSGNLALDQGGSDKDDLRKLADADKKQIQDIYKKYSTKTLSTGDAASLEAELKVEDSYRGLISKKTQDIALAQRQVVDLQKQVAATTGEAKLDAQSLVDEAKKRVVAEQGVLAVVEAQASAQSKLAGSKAASLQVKSETAEAGWDKFWKQYTDSALTSAAIVENSLKSVTDSLAGGLTNAAATGKLELGGMARAVAADLTKVVIKQQIGKLAGSLGLGGSAVADTAKAAADAADLAATTSITAATVVQTTAATALTAALYAASAAASQFLLSSSLSGGGFGLGSLGDVFSADGGGFSFSDVLPFFGFAKGGIMTPQGPMPLRRYAKGGITHGPEYSVHGEGSLPEANIPLQDGRTVPVTLNGDGSSSKASVSLSYSPTIHIDSRTDQAQVAQLVQASVAQGQKQMLQHLKDTGVIA
jgi:TP901 family phage tail tape measure protein